MDKMKTTEELVNKMHVSYTEAKEALEATGWNMLDAAVYIENTKKDHSSSKLKEAADKAAGGIRKVWNYCKDRDLEIFKNNTRAASLPLPAAIVLTALLLEIALPAAVIAMLFGVSFKISNEREAIGYGGNCGFTLNTSSNTVNLNK